MKEIRKEREREGEKGEGEREGRGVAFYVSLGFRVGLLVPRMTLICSLSCQSTFILLPIRKC